MNPPTLRNGMLLQVHKKCSCRCSRVVVELDPLLDIVLHEIAPLVRLDVPVTSVPKTSGVEVCVAISEFNRLVGSMVDRMSTGVNSKYHCHLNACYRSSPRFTLVLPLPILTGSPTSLECNLERSDRIHN